jgi:hypothetical protein
MASVDKQALFDTLKAMLLGDNKKYRYKLMMLNSHMEALTAIQMSSNKQFSQEGAVVAIKRSCAQYADENNAEDASVDAEFEQLMYQTVSNGAVGFTYRMTSKDGKAAIVQGLCFDVSNIVPDDDSNESIEL